MGGEGRDLTVLIAVGNAVCFRKYPLTWVEEAKAGKLGFQERFGGRWFVALDAASLVSTSPLDLTTVRPDFLTLSFYKIFGFPTGLGKSASVSVLLPVLRLPGCSRCPSTRYLAFRLV